MVARGAADDFEKGKQDTDDDGPSSLRCVFFARCGPWRRPSTVATSSRPTCWLRGSKRWSCARATAHGTERRSQPAGSGRGRDASKECRRAQDAPPPVEGLREGRAEGRQQGRREDGAKDSAPAEWRRSRPRPRHPGFRKRNLKEAPPLSRPLLKTCFAGASWTLTWETLDTVMM